MELSLDTCDKTKFQWHLNGHNVKTEQDKAKIIKEKLDELSDLCLDTATELKSDGTYTTEDMSNAVLVFQEVFMNLAFRNWVKIGMTQEQRAVLSRESGATIHKLTLLTTGIDLKDVHKN